MELINPGVHRRSIFCLLIFIAAYTSAAQSSKEAAIKFSHPVLSQVNHLVNQFQYQKAIDLSLKEAINMKAKKNWEGYTVFMLRAAEIETFEVWKAKSLTKSKMLPDYRRPLTYLDSLYKYGKEQLKTNPYLKANTLFTTAVVYHWLDMPDTSESMHNQALQLRIKLFGRDSREVADSYLWMGVLYNWGLRRLDVAKEYYLKAMALQKKYMPQSRYSLGSTYFGLAIVARANYDFDETITMLKEYSSLYFDLPYEQAAALQLLANIYTDQGDFEKALQERMQSLKIYESAGLTEDLIIQYGNLSNNLIDLGRTVEAREALRKGFWMLERLEVKKTFYTKFLYESLGSFYVDIEKYDSAQIFFDKALRVAIDEYGEKNSEVAETYGLRGNLYLKKNDFKSSLIDFQQMLTSVIPNFNGENIFRVPTVQNETPYFYIIISALFHKGDAFLAWYNHDKKSEHLQLALDHYRAAYGQLMVARKAIGDELSKPVLMKSFSESIEKSIQCAKTLYTLTEQQNFFQDIFHFVELTKYLNVLDALQRAERANNSGIPKHLLFELEEIKNELNVHQKVVLSEKASRGKLAHHNEIILNLINKRRELIAEISKYPEYVVSNIDEVLTDVSEVQNKLSHDEQIIEFFWGQDSVYTLSITKGSVEILSTHPSDETDSLFNSIHEIMIDNNNPFDKNNYSVMASAIYKEFFAPSIKMKKITIIPDGPLRLIAVEALVVEHNPAKTSFNELDYVIYHREIAYAYSTSILFRSYLKNVKGVEKVLAFSYSNGVGEPGLAKRSQHTELPGTYKELEALSRLFKNVTRFTDINASKLNFINNTMGHDIIHLGVHGIGDQYVADNSRLIFRSDSLDDGELFAYEIYNLKMDARLVVLSACESGTGRNQSGEGMFSIARAFTYAGCPSLVMSLWQARDVFTSQIMIGFYENLNHNESISSSLRNAKLQFLKESDSFTAHPANWAPFVVNGLDLTFEKKSKSNFLIYLIVVTAIIATAFYLKTKKFHA